MEMKTYEEVRRRFLTRIAQTPLPAESLESIDRILLPAVNEGPPAGREARRKRKGGKLVGSLRDVVATYTPCIPPEVMLDLRLAQQYESRCLVAAADESMTEVEVSIATHALTLSNNAFIVPHASSSSGV